MFKKILTLAAIFILTVPLLSGCWDRTEIEQRAAVLGIAIDLPDGEQDALDVTHPPNVSTSPRVSLTAYIAVPGRIALGAEGGGGGQSGSAEEKSIWPLQAAGENIADALANLQQKVAETLFLGHLRVIVVSKELAERGLADVNDYFRRSPKVRRTTWMMVSEKRAADLMSVAPPMERVPILYILQTMERAEDMGKLPRDFVGNFWTLESSDGQDGYLPYISKEGDSNIKINGLACFHGNKLAITSSPFEIMTLMEINGMNPAGYSIPVHTDDGVFEVTVFRRLARIHTQIVNGVPVARVSIHLDVNISEKWKGTADLQNPATISSIKQAVNDGVHRSCLAFIKKTQKNQTDIFGFGEHLRAAHPAYWQSKVRSKSNWEKLYPALKIDIKVTSRIHRMGMKTV